VVKGEKAYYFDKTGQMVCGQLVKDKTGNLYYFGKKGTMVKSKTVKVDGVTYTFDANGIGTAQNAAA
jgi:glucan-binding YG repeat protein